MIQTLAFVDFRIGTKNVCQLYACCFLHNYLNLIPDVSVFDKITNGAARQSSADAARLKTMLTLSENPPDLVIENTANGCWTSSPPRSPGMAEGSHVMGETEKPETVTKMDTLETEMDSVMAGSADISRVAYGKRLNILNQSIIRFYIIQRDTVIVKFLHMFRITFVEFVKFY